MKQLLKTFRSSTSFMTVAEVSNLTDEMNNANRMSGFPEYTTCHDVNLTDVNTIELSCANYRGNGIFNTSLITGYVYYRTFIPLGASPRVG